MRQASVNTKLAFDDPTEIPVIEFDLTLANKIPSLTTAIYECYCLHLQRACFQRVFNE